MRPKITRIPENEYDYAEKMEHHPFSYGAWEIDCDGYEACVHDSGELRRLDELSCNLANTDIADQLRYYAEFLITVAETVEAIATTRNAELATLDCAVAND